MKFRAAVTIIPKDESKSTNEKTLINQLKKHNINNVKNIKEGRFFSVKIDASSKNTAIALISEVSDLLIDRNIETASFVVEEV